MARLDLRTDAFSFMDDAEESDASEDEVPQNRRGRASVGQRRDRGAEKEKLRKRLREDITKAAGGPLVGA